MTYRRIVTGHDHAGRSMIASDGAIGDVVLPGFGAIARLWSSDTPMQYPHDGTDPDAAAIFPPPGGVRFAIVTMAPVPPEKTPDHEIATEGDSYWHRTNSTDMLYLLSGSIRLEVDCGGAVLNPGDIVVQNGTRHLWTVLGDRPAILLSVTAGATRAGP